MTIFLHRHQTHRAISLHPLVNHIFRFWLWLTTGIIAREWVAIHRKHSAKVETTNDPHSPQIQRITQVLFRGWLLYRREARSDETLRLYGAGSPDDWLERHLYARFPSTGIILMLLTDLLLFGPLAGIIIWVIQMLWIPTWAAGVINGLGHWCGYRNYELGDASRNILPWGLFIGGEELHNNHHAYSASAQFSIRPFEIDLGWLYIRLMVWLRLTIVHKTAPNIVQRAGRTHCDTETLRAVIASRFKITSRFSREVVRQICREETTDHCLLHRLQRLSLKKAPRLIQRESLGLNAVARQHLQTALAQSPSLDAAYHAKLRLQEIWSRSTSNGDALLRQLEDWCHNAENSGIETLRNFSLQLRGYRLVES